MTDTITSNLAQETSSALADLSRANKIFMRRFPGDSPHRQPVHSVYGGAQLYKAETTSKLGELAMRAFKKDAPDAFTFAKALELQGHEALDTTAQELKEFEKTYAQAPDALRESCFGAWLAQTVYERVENKIKQEAVEDYRIDFEDGYGTRSDDEEDAEALRTASELARAMAENTAPPFIGIRIKTLTEELTHRAVRTLDIFVSTLIEATGGKLPENFVVTLPKVTIPEQVTALVRMFEVLEHRLGLSDGSLKLELMVEVTQSLFNSTGRAHLPVLFNAAEGRCVAAHFGTYDYTASCSITAAYQTMDHAACDFARSMMINAYGGTGIFLSDGATNVMPVGPHKAAKGSELNAEEQAANRTVVHQAWKLAFEHTRHSLENGIYQGWDLHPGQLPVRYAACYSFFLEGFNAAAERLSNFVSKAAQATLVGDVFDDAATGQGLLNYFLRALNCGAVSLDELAVTGLTQEEIQMRSFGRILEARRKRISA
ncbi:MAG: phosphoenolpyruvate kinase [Deltaproteobacteria bacterium]|jgi:citrate lyase beta subunit|nr:phosphoenolpyruvate kinase [Deltaproteobacteria bacterium]MBT6436312.1 phosphoenolpyruvate kinase [Deltaproteobacteria bacterium]MBT6488154.1 phosphoenolpyruvate kinase [Deltaproteobacteria bacterium]